MRYLAERTVQCRQGHRGKATLLLIDGRLHWSNELDKCLDCGEPIPEDTRQTVLHSLLDQALYHHRISQEFFEAEAAKIRENGAPTWERQVADAIGRLG